MSDRGKQKTWKAVADKQGRKNNQPRNKFAHWVCDRCRREVPGMTDLVYVHRRNQRFCKACMAPFSGEPEVPSE